jgi:hypothetical protein
MCDAARAVARALLAFLVAFGAAPAEATPPPDDPVAVLREADRARGNLGGVTWELDIDSRENGRASAMSVRVKSRGYDFVSENLSPDRSKGQKLLMASGSMWFHKPGLSKPVPVARRQRLIGQAAYGDIAATNYAEEYDAVITGEEAVDGEPCTVFDLKAKKKNTTYDRIRYWVSRTRGVGVRGEYYTVSGKLIKTAVMEYDLSVEREGRSQPFISRIVIHDALIDDSVTTLTFRKPVFSELPDHVFNVDMLGR